MSYQHKGLFFTVRAEQKKSKQMRSNVLQEAVVNMFSKMEKFKYKLTVLAVGRENTVV